MSAQAKSSKMSSSIDTSHLKIKFPFKAKYGNFIGGKFVEPKSGKYFDNTTFCEIMKSLFRVVRVVTLTGGAPGDKIGVFKVEKSSEV